MAKQKKFLVVNADDLGQSKEVNEGIAAAHKAGLVRSASLLVTGEAVESAVAMARKNPGLDVGLHLALNETIPAADPARVPGLLTRDGRMPKRYPNLLARVATGIVRMEEVRIELEAQFRRFLDYRLTLRHVDFHQHLHAMPPVAEVVAELCRTHGARWIRIPHELIPPRGERGENRSRAAACLAVGKLAERARQTFQDMGLRTPDAFFGFLDSGHLTLTSVRRMVSRFPDGVTELMVHPGTVNEEHTGYRRADELDLLCAPSLASWLADNGVLVTSFAELK